MTLMMINKNKAKKTLKSNKPNKKELKFNSIKNHKETSLWTDKEKNLEPI